MTSQTIFHAITLFVIVLIFAACKPAPPVAQQTPSATPQPSATSTPPQQSEDDGKSAEDFFMKEDKLLYNGYEIAKLQKTVNEQDTKMDVTYIAVKKGGRIIATFDGPHHPIGNIADFGLFPFLGGDKKQLIVSITIPRGGRQWIVDLDSGSREIFSTEQWQVGREDADLSFTDLDKDSVLEIEAGEFWYYVFSEISMSETPVVNVIFKYDAKAMKYVPANHHFPEYSLQGIEEAIASLPVNEGYGYLGRRVDILLTYLYAGKENEGWAFFDRSYPGKDKAQIKARIRKVLNNSAVYQYVRKHHKNQRQQKPG